MFFKDESDTETERIMSEDLSDLWPVAILGTIAAIPLIGGLLSLVLSSSSQSQTSGGVHSNPGGNPGNPGNPGTNPGNSNEIEKKWYKVKYRIQVDGRYIPDEFDVLAFNEEGAKYATYRQAYTYPGYQGIEYISVRKMGNSSSNPEAKIDAKLEPLREHKREEWTAAGYPEGLIEKALQWAEGYTIGMATKITEDPIFRMRIEQELYPKALSMAEPWLKGLTEFLK